MSDTEVSKTVRDDGGGGPDLKVAVGVRDGEVLIAFSSLVGWLLLSPDEAEDLGRLIVGQAQAIRRGPAAGV